MKGVAEVADAPSAMGGRRRPLLSSLLLVLLLFVLVRTASALPVATPDEEDAEEPEIDVDSIRRALIEGLGFKRMPDVTKMNVSQDEYIRMHGVYLKRLEERHNENPVDNDPAPVLYTYHQKETRTRRRRRRDVTYLRFVLEATEGTPERAVLRFLVPGHGQDLVGPVLIQVHQVMDNQRTQPVTEKELHLDARDPKWCELDVTDAIHSHVANNRTGLELELHWPFSHRAAEPASASLHVLARKDVVRSKRSADVHRYYTKNRKTDCRKNNKRCCRHRMDFEFSQLGSAFEFVIQPKSFDGGICKGKCPPYYNTAHNHALLQSLMWKKNKSLMPRVCCAPSKLQYLEVLSMDDVNTDKLTVKQIEGMTVLECRCS